MKFEATIGRRRVAVEENLVDRAIRFFDPLRANKRVAARLSAAAVGGYVGASTARRQTLSWQAQKGDADAVILYDLPTLRERSRDLLRNAPLAAGAVNTVVNTDGVLTGFNTDWLGIRTPLAERTTLTGKRVALLPGMIVGGYR